MAPNDITWRPLKIGAGGWITGIDIDKTGTTYVLRTDTYGGYVGGPTGEWRQVLRTDTMPAGFDARSLDGASHGIYELRVAPSDPNRVYMVRDGKVYRSNDRCATWVQTALSYAGAMDPNDGYRYWGEKAAVDPINPDVLYVGTVSGGLYVTMDGGATWAQVTSVGVPGAQGITGIVFDASSGATGGKTNTVYACRNGTGVYRTTNAGSTWALMSGSPTTVTHAAVATDGVYFAANMGTSIHRFSGGSWATSASTGQTLHSIACDPNNPARIIAGRDSGHLAVSTDRGVTWAGGGMIWTATRTATDVPWLQFAVETYMSNGGMLFDPVTADKLWFAEGIGVWYCSSPGATSGTAWVSRSAGIEQLVGRDVCVPPGGPNVITAGMDRSVFVLPKGNTSYPSRYVTMGSSASLIPAWAVDYSATNPAHIVAIINGSGNQLSGYSLDSGATWTKFPVEPATGTSGDIVAPSIDSIIAVIGSGGAWRSTNRGASWTALGLPGITWTATDKQYLHDGYNIKKHILAVDGATPTTVYLYFYGHGVYRSLDSGATWSLVSSSTFDGGNMYWQVKLRSVPGRAGHLFLTAGQAGGAGAANPDNTRLYRSTDGGATWTTVAGMAEPYDVAIGAAAPGGSYPAVYVVGWYSGEYGIWRSIDNCATWEQVGPYPLNSVDEINVISASVDTYGEVYVAFAGSGWAKGVTGYPVTFPSDTTWEAHPTLKPGTNTFLVSDGVDTVTVVYEFAINQDVSALFGATAGFGPDSIWTPGGTASFPLTSGFSAQGVWQGPGTLGMGATGAVVMDATFTPLQPFSAFRLPRNLAVGKSYLAGPYQRIVYMVGDVAIPVTAALQFGATVQHRGAVPFGASIAVTQDATFAFTGWNGATVLGVGAGLTSDAVVAYATQLAYSAAAGLSVDGAVAYEDAVALVTVSTMDADASFEVAGEAGATFPANHGLIIDATVTYSHRTGEATVQATEAGAVITSRVVVATVTGAPDAGAVVLHRDVQATIKANH